MLYLDTIRSMPGWTAQYMPAFADGIHLGIPAFDREELVVEYGERELAAVLTVRSQWEEWLAGTLLPEFRCLGETGLQVRVPGAEPLVLLSSQGDGSGVADQAACDLLHRYLSGCLTLLLTGSILAHQTLAPLCNAAWNSLGASIIESLDHLWQEAEPLRRRLHQVKALEIIADGCAQGAATMTAELLGARGVPCLTVDAENWGHVNFYAQHREEIGVLLFCQGGLPDRSYLEIAAGMAVGTGRPVLWVGDDAPRQGGDIASLVLTPFPGDCPAVGAMVLVLASTLLLNDTGGTK